MVLLQAEVAADRDLVVGRADVEDLLVAEAGCVRLWRVACGHLYPDPGAIVVVWCYQVVAVLFCRRNDVEAALEDHDPFLRTLGRCGSRCTVMWTLRVPLVGTHSDSTSSWSRWEVRFLLLASSARVEFVTVLVPWQVLGPGGYRMNLEVVVLQCVECVDTLFVVQAQ